MTWEDIPLPILEEVRVFTTEKGICAIFLGRGKEKESARFIEKCPVPVKLSEKPTKHSSIHTALKEYVEGKRTTFSFPFDFLTGTPFEKEVWRVLPAIPYGRCVSYQWVATRIGRPRATRAVGNAIGKNPIPILIPCHRVIRKNGSLGGFSSGLAIKEALLKIEGCSGPPSNLPETGNPKVGS